MAGTPGGVLNTIGTALIPETMARFQMPGLIEQAERKQQVGNIQAGRLLGGMNAEIGTPQTKSYQVNGRTIGQDNPSTIQPLFSQTKKNALFSQAFPEQARALQAQQIQNAIAPSPLTKDDFLGEPGRGVFNIRTQSLVPGTQAAPKEDVPEDVKLALWLNGGDEFKARKWLDAQKAKANPQKSPVQIYEETYGKLETGMSPEVVGGRFTGKQVPTQGSSKDPATIEQNRLRELEAAFPKVSGAVDNTVGELDKTIAAIDEIISPQNDTGLGDITGFGGTAVGDAMTLPGSEGAKVRAKVKQVEGRAFLAGLQTMKASSPSGATGLGATSEREGAAVTQAQAALDRAQSKEDYTKALRDYRSALVDARKNIRTTFESEYAPLIKNKPATPSGATGYWGDDGEDIEALVNKYAPRQ